MARGGSVAKGILARVAALTQQVVRQQKQLDRRQKSEKGAASRAEYWRGRATETKSAANIVAEKERCVAELSYSRNFPSAEVKLATLLAKKQMKPADILSKMDQVTHSRICPSSARYLPAASHGASPRYLSDVSQMCLACRTSHLSLPTNGQPMTPPLCRTAAAALT